MKIPKSINVLGRPYKIKTGDYSSEEICGKCDKENKVIYICLVNNKSTLDKLHTFAHELGHAAWEESGLGQTSISGDLEEIIVQQFATVYLSVFKILFRKELLNE